MESKAAFIKALLPVIQMTRSGSNVTDMEYIQNEQGEFVIITFDNCYHKTVNVTADSETAMMRDISRAID